jgi:hypothetical protein
MTNAIANLHRAARGKTALAVIVEETRAGTSIDEMDNEELSAAIADLITDLFQLAHYASLHPQKVMSQAWTNFRAEQVEE